MTPLILLLNLLLLTRMVYLRSDGPLGLTANLSLWIIQLSLLFLTCAPTAATGWVAGLLTLCFAINTAIEQAHLELARGWRGLALLLLIIGCTAIQQGTTGLELSWITERTIATVQQYLAALLPATNDASPTPAGYSSDCCCWPTRPTYSSAPPFTGSGWSQR